MHVLQLSNIKHWPTLSLPEKDEGGYAWSSWTWWEKTTFLLLEEFGAQGGGLMVRMGTTNWRGQSLKALPDVEATQKSTEGYWWVPIIWLKSQTCYLYSWEIMENFEDPTK